MFAASQTRRGFRIPALRRRLSAPGGGVLLGLVLWLSGLEPVGAQVLRLGLFDLSMVGKVDLAYDSNVDDVPSGEPEKPGFPKDDFYWMPGLTINSQPVAMRPNTLVNMTASIAYQDYFTRHDLDTELYNLMLNFQTSHPRLTLGGMASADYSIENTQEEYIPGGFSRDPVLTHTAGFFANWNYRILRLVGNAMYTRERHDYEEYWAGDNDEVSLLAGIYLDVWSWGSLFYTWERTTTTMILADNETIETTETFGIMGTIPVELFRRPKIDYSLGVSREEELNAEETEETEWEFVHTITVSDKFDLSKTIRLDASASWVNTVVDDEVTFQYNLTLSQILSPRAQHSLSFTQEPRPTFGSNTETETTTYGYNLEIRDVIIYNLNFALGATYEENTPLEEVNALTETTTTLNWGLTHTRQFSRKLSRTLSYQYSWEDSNFEKSGATEKHLIIYGLSYTF
jgi:hypothetical protein